MIVADYIYKNESLENWSELGNMTTMKGVKNVGMDQIMNLMLEQSKQNSPKAKLQFIEKDETSEYPWIIFTIESPSFKNDKRPESQLWFIVQGKQALYTNFRAVKKAKISEEDKAKWIAFFKTGQVVTK